MPTGQFDKPKPNKLIAAMQALQNKSPVTAVNRLYVSAVQHYYGTWQSAEVADANLSIVQLQGGARVRFVPKVASVTGLSAGDTIVLQKSPAFPLHITGKLVGDFTLALNSVSNVTAPTAPGTLHVTAHTSSSVTLAWTASTDFFGSGLVYNVYVNGSFKQSTALNAVTSVVSGLTAGTSYSFYVVAADGAGNASNPSNTVSQTTSGSAPVPPGTTVTKTYNAISLHPYNYSGDNKLNSGSVCYQGDDQSGGYNRIGLIMFNDSQIRADLAGNDVITCKISLTYAHWWYNSGGTAILGTHDYSSVPSVVSRFHGTTAWALHTPHSDVGKRLTVDLGNDVAENFKSGDAKGILIGPAPNQSPTYYGYTYGLGSHVPVLTLTYTTN